MSIKHFFILWVTLFISLGASAQVGLNAIPKSSNELTQAESFESSSLVQISNSLDKYYAIGDSNLSDVTMTLEQPPLGMFCKLDKSLDQKFPFNLRFRLGEYHYTNGLEYGDELGRRATNTALKEQSSSN